MKIGKPVFKAMMQGQGGAPDYISSDCQLSGHHIAQGIDELKLAVDKVPVLAHPMTLIAKAYGVDR